MDGWAFLTAYQQHPRAPVILLTAATVASDGTMQGRPLPEAAGRLAKPFDLDDLLALVCQIAQAHPTPSAGRDPSRWCGPSEDPPRSHTRAIARR